VREHADAETLAAFREELLPRRKAARVSAHLAACSRCAELDAQLTEVSALLATSATPPMPDALTARIEAAIAAEAAARAATAADGIIATADRAVSGGNGTVAVGAAGAGTGPRDRAARPSRPAAGRGRSWLALRVAAVAAAFVVVAGGSYGAARLLSGNPESATSSGSGSAAAPAAPAAGVSGKAAAKASGGLRIPSAGKSAPAARIVSSGTNYQPGQLGAQVSAVLSQHGASAGAATGPGASAANQPAAAAPHVPACVPHVTGGKRLLLVDRAKYQGRPATVIVTPGATSGTVRALVVAGACTATNGHVLATTTFPRSG
jgi:hypothetical protein